MLLGWGFTYKRRPLAWNARCLSTKVFITWQHLVLPNQSSRRHHGGQQQQQHAAATAAGAAARCRGWSGGTSSTIDGSGGTAIHTAACGRLGKPHLVDSPSLAPNIGCAVPCPLGVRCIRKLQDACVAQHGHSVGAGLASEAGALLSMEPAERAAVPAPPWWLQVHGCTCSCRCGMEGHTHPPTNETHHGQRWARGMRSKRAGRWGRIGRPAA